MELKDLHFAYPWWLWANVAIPLIWALFFLFYRIDRPFHQLEKFIDSHLLPYLLINRENKKKSFWKTLLLWSMVWIFFTVALAGPRWNFREIETFSRDQSLVILLDLSESMDATDIKPSRLVRAKQKIEDLINLSKGVKIGLIAFAADPHMIAPITDDKEMIRHLLPSLGTDLVYIQGSRLAVALDMASTMLEVEPGTNKAILVISDGGFEDASAVTTVKKLADQGLVIHAMGVGTRDGAPLKDHQGNLIKKNGVPILSKLEKDKLIGVSEVGKGRYLEAHYSDHDEVLILKELEKSAEAQMNQGKKNELWDERFYLILLPALPIILWWFRRGYVFSMLPILFIPFSNLEASAVDYLKNSEELGKQSLDAGNYEDAILKFQDPYRKGVAYYRAGQFAEAEEMFRSSTRPDVALNAAYNLGNALVQQQKWKEAVKAYENVLEYWPECTKAKDNLELVKSMMQEQKQDGGSDSGEDSDEKDSNKEGDKEGSDFDEKESSDQKEDQKEDLDSKDSKDKQEMPQTEESEERQEPEKNLEANDSEEKEEDQEEIKTCQSQEDQDADLWLNQISNDPKTFLKNKFYIESKRNGTTKGVDPW